VDKDGEAGSRQHYRVIRDRLQITGENELALHANEMVTLALACQRFLGEINNVTCCIRLGYLKLNCSFGIFVF
jgi:hypothetical protein